MASVRARTSLSPANVLADRPQRVDVERVHQRPVQRGQAEQVHHTRQADTVFPTRKGAGVGESENASGLALLQAPGPAVLAEVVRDGCVLDLCHKQLLM